MKKLIRVTVVSEIEVDADEYENMSNDEIIDAEKQYWQEWILDHVVSERIAVTDMKSEVIDG